MNRRTAVGIVLFAAGAALLVWIVRYTGVETVRDGFASVGAGFVPILVLSFFRFVLRARAWTALIATPVPLTSATAATIAGDTLGNVTPLGLVASEPAKAMFLARVVPARTSLASLTAENFFYSVSVALYVIAGAAVMLLAFDVHDLVRWLGLVSLAGMLAVLGGAGWLAWQRPAVVSAVLAGLPSRRLAVLVERVREFERQAYDAARGAGRLPVVVAAAIGFHLLSFLECWLTVWLLTGSAALLPALVFDAVQRVINVLFKMVPMRVGVEEGGTALVALAIGLPADVGVQLGLVRKVRLIFWAAVGLLLLARRGASRQSAT